MKFRIRVSYRDADEEEREEAAWWEEYDKNEVDDARAWAEETIERFNATLRPHERPRQLLDVEVLEGDTRPDHGWVKTSLTMHRDPRRDQIYDTYKCTHCGITGRRYGIAGPIEKDPRYARAEVYERCDTAQAHLEEHGHPEPRRKT